MLKLVDGTDIVLPSQLILQFQSNNRNTVHGKHHIDGVGVCHRITELTGAAEDVCFIAFSINGVQIRLRLKEANLQFATHVLNAIAQAMIQLVRCVDTIILVVLGPFFGLSLGNEFTEHIHIDAFGNIMLTSMYPIALGILSAKLSVTTFRGNQEGFYISLKSLFAFVHHDTSS